MKTEIVLVDGRGQLYVRPGSVITFEDNYTGTTEYYLNGRSINDNYGRVNLIVNSDVDIEETWGSGWNNPKVVRITSANSTVQ